MSKQGKLIGVSLGPGDPGLITRAAWEQLQRQDAIWTYPIRNKKSPSYALDIVLRAGMALPEQHSPLIFPMTHDVEKLARYWVQAANTVSEYLHQGRDVLFLVEGDASTYSTFTHLSRSVKALEQDIDVVTIAGVPSFHAASATLQQPIADVDDTVAIIPAGYGINLIEELLKNFDTLVLLKVKPLLDDILHLLDKHQLSQHTRFIEKAGSPEERIIHDVQSLKNQSVNYLSLMIIRNHHRVRGEIIRGCRKKTTLEQNTHEEQA